MSDNPFEDISKKVRRSLVKRKAGRKQLLLGLGMFVVVTALLAVNLIPTEHVPEPFNLVRLAGVALLVFGILIFSGIFLYDYRPYTFNQPQLLLLLGSSFVAITVLAKVMSVLAIAGNAYWGYLIPVAFVAMLVTLLFDPYLAIMLVISSSIIVGYVMYGDFYYTMTALLGGMVAVYTTTGIEERTELTRAGIITGLSMAFFAFAAGFLEGSASSALMNGVVGFLNGLFSAILALGTLPFLEKHLGILTPMRLLELSNPNRPLLRRLMTEAPGTYGHSVGVGNLAEASAEATGANALLIRVGAYYHDIGKLKRPSFFVENQAGNGNKHENINPKLSTLVITSHVKEGVELGREEGLPQPILDLIDQHHGRSVVAFFYHQARKEKKGKTVTDD
ncbi:MAG: HDIG domain-containing metalloprotein, partial [Actinomycetota bacterium]